MLRVWVELVRARRRLWRRVATREGLCVLGKVAVIMTTLGLMTWLLMAHGINMGQYNYDWSIEPMCAEQQALRNALTQWGGVGHTGNAGAGAGASTGTWSDAGASDRTGPGDSLGVVRTPAAPSVGSASSDRQHEPPASPVVSVVLPLLPLSGDAVKQSRDNAARPPAALFWADVRATVESVYAQTLRSFEVLLVQCASPSAAEDASAAAAWFHPSAPHAERSFGDARVRWETLPATQACWEGALRQYGSEAALGTYHLQATAGDRLHPTFLEHCVLALDLTALNEEPLTVCTAQTLSARAPDVLNRLSVLDPAATGRATAATEPLADPRPDGSAPPIAGPLLLGHDFLETVRYRDELRPAADASPEERALRSCLLHWDLLLSAAALPRAYVPVAVPLPLAVSARQPVCARLPAAWMQEHYRRYHRALPADALRRPPARARSVLPLGLRFPVFPLRVGAGAGAAATAPRVLVLLDGRAHDDMVLVALLAARTLRRAGLGVSLLLTAPVARSAHAARAEDPLVASVLQHWPDALWLHAMSPERGSLPTALLYALHARRPDALLLAGSVAAYHFLPFVVASVPAVPVLELSRGSATGLLWSVRSAPSVCRTLVPSDARADALVARGLTRSDLRRTAVLGAAGAVAAAAAAPSPDAVRVLLVGPDDIERRLHSSALLRALVRARGVHVQALLCRSDRAGPPLHDVAAAGAAVPCLAPGDADAAAEALLSADTVVWLSGSGSGSGSGSIGHDDSEGAVSEAQAWLEPALSGRGVTWAAVQQQFSTAEAWRDALIQNRARRRSRPSDAGSTPYAELAELVRGSCAADSGSGQRDYMRDQTDAPPGAAVGWREVRSGHERGRADLAALRRLDWAHRALEALPVDA